MKGRNSLGYSRSMSSPPRLTLLLLLAALLSACASVSDRRPEVVRKSEYYLEQGVDAFANSDYVAAASFFKKALGHYRSIDDTRGILLSRINLAETAMATGNTTAVQRQLDDAEAVIERSENLSRFRPRLQLLQAQLEWRIREKRTSLALVEPLLPAFDDTDLPEERPSLLELTALTLRTDIAFSAIDTAPDEARRWLRRLDAALARNSDTTPLHDARLNRFRALLAHRSGDTATALKLLDDAMESYRVAAVRPALAATLTETARLYMSQEAWATAIERLQRALYIRVWIMDRVGSREVLLLLEAAYREQGDEVRARLSHDYALSIEDGNGNWSGLQNDLLQRD